jgi:hypothetical protein
VTGLIVHKPRQRPERVRTRSSAFPAVALQRAWSRQWSPARWSDAQGIAWIYPGASPAERHLTGQRARSRARSALSPEGRRDGVSPSGRRVPVRRCLRGAAPAIGRLQVKRRRNLLLQGNPSFRRRRRRYEAPRRPWQCGSRRSESSSGRGNPLRLSPSRAPRRS